MKKASNQVTTKAGGSTAPEYPILSTFVDKKNTVFITRIVGWGLNSYFFVLCIYDIAHSFSDFVLGLH